MKKKAQVIMLPTTQDSRIFIHDGKLQSCYDGGAAVANDIDWKCQHLYIVSDDKIKEGDWCLFFWDGMKDGELGQIGSEPQRYFPENGHTLNRNLRKIIATTDTQLLVQGFTSKESKEWKSIFELPQPSQSFIESYCKNPVDKVMVEYESINLTGDFTPNKILPSGSWVFRPKLTSNNELIISMVGLTAEDIIEQMGWNYENTESSARRVAEFCAKNMNWIKENL
jgi:hypothetical protein